MFVRARVLDQLLGIKTPDAADEFAFSYQNTGPGYLDTWLSLVEGKENCWQQTQLTRTQQSKPKIIISNTQLNEYALPSMELALIRTLIENYDVYLWRDNVALADSKPLSSSIDFHEQKSTFTAATKNTVEHDLAQQGESRNDYIILDYAAYNKLLADYDEWDRQEKHKKVIDGRRNALRERFIPDPDGMLDLNKFFMPFDVDEISKLVDLKTIRIIKTPVPTPKEINFIINLPNVELVSIENNEENDDKKLDKAVSALAEYGIGVECINGWYTENLKASHKKIIMRDIYGRKKVFVGAEKIDDSSADLVEEISFEKYKSVQSVDLATSAIKRMYLSECFLLKVVVFGNERIGLEEIKIINCPELLVFGNSHNNDFSQLQRLELSECPEFYVEEIPKMQNLTAFSIRRCAKFDAYDMQEVLSLPALTHFKIENQDVAGLDFFMARNLQVLEIRNCQNLMNINLANLDKLKVLRIIDCTHLQDIDFPYMPDLEELELSDLDEIKNLDLTKLPRLKKIVINGMRNVSVINLNGLWNIEELQVSNCKYAVVESDGINYAKLRNLNFNGIKQQGFREVVLFAHPNVEKSCLPGAMDYVFTGNKELKELELEFINKEFLHLVFPDKLESIELLDIYNARNLENLLGLKNLRQLKIENTVNTAIDMQLIAKLKSLQEITLKYVDIIGEKIDIRTLDQLKMVILESVSFNDIKLPGQLTHFEIRGCANPFMDSIDLTGGESLRFLKLDGLPRLSNFNCSALLKLEELEISDCRLEDIDFSLFPNLKRLHINGDYINCNLLRFPKLEQLTIRGAHYGSLDNCKALKIVHINSPGSIEKLNFSNCSQLQEVSINTGYVGSIDFSGCNSLFSCGIRSTGIGDMTNLSDCENLRKLYVVTQKPNDALVDKMVRSVPDCCQTFLVLGEEDLSEEETKAENSEYSQTYADKSKNEKLIRLNEANPVSLVSMNLFSGSSNVDSDTQISAVEYKADRSDISYMLESNTPVSRHNYRMTVDNQVLYKNGKISFIASNKRVPIVHPSIPLDDQEFSKQKEFVHKFNHYTSGYSTLKIQHNTFYPMVNNGPCEFGSLAYLATRPDGLLDYFWNEEAQLYEFRLKPSANPQEIELLYTFKKNDSYQNYEPGAQHGQLVTQSPNKLLPPALIKDLTRELSKHKEFQILFSNASIEDKIKFLFLHCQGFQNEKLKSKPKTDLEKILATLFEQRGACRHRANDFMLLARLIGVPVLGVSNEMHRFCEIPFIDPSDKSIKFYHAEFGGAPVLDLTALEKRDSQNVFLKAELSKNAPTKQRVDERKEEKPAEKAYYDYFKGLVSQHEVSSIDVLLDPSLPLAPVIKMQANENSFTVTQEIINQLTNVGVDTKHKVLYIHSAADFELYLKPYAFIDGQRRRIPGPLADLIQKGGVLIVNWSQFSPAEVTSYKSIIDKVPTLLGEPVTKNLTVIGLEAEGSDACDAFKSRTLRFGLHNDFYHSKPIAVDKNKDREPLEIDLFKRNNWRELLLGKIHFSRDKVELVAKDLMRAIAEKRPLVIHNPPATKDFTDFLRKIQAERKILYNGELIFISKKVVITTDVKPHVNTLANVSIELAESNAEIAGQNCIYLGLHNLHECVEQLAINSKHEPEIIEHGLLGVYNPDQQFFYLTEPVPQNEWQALLDHIERHHREKKFKFVFAPGVYIEGVAENSHARGQSEKEIDAPVQVSNDPDYHVLQLYEAHKQDEKGCMIFDITPQSNFGNLVAKTIVDTKSDPSKPIFTYQEEKILRALKKGKTVILNGALSPGLYNQLLPLFSPEPHIYLNGRRIKIDGKLIAVLPQAQAQKLPLLDFTVHDYEIEDYKKSFSHHDHAYVDQIHAFYQLAQKFPRHGPGRPELLEYSHAKLKHMIAVLKGNKLHKHNPVKGLFHYDFPKNSDDYAYHAFIAKYIFSENDDSAFKEHKLRQLIIQHKINSPEAMRNQIWKILNCFNGQELHELLGDDLFQVLDFSESFPSLHTTAMLQIWQFLERQQILQDKPIAEKESSHVEKRTRQLHVLLEDESTFFIMLKGAPGVGKTYAVKQLRGELNFAYHEGEDAILAWLIDKSDKPVVLLLDEANLAKPGTWDFLKGLTRNHRTVFYKGKKYELSERHKVIMTGNPENYPDRSYHALFQNYAETLYFSLPERHYLEQTVLRKILEPRKLYRKEYTAALLDVYDLITEYNPTYVYSTRDLESAALRFSVLAAGRHDSYAIKQALLAACIAEFSGTVHDPKKRMEFIEKLSQRLFVSVRPPKADILELTNHFAVSSEYAYLVEAIEQDFHILDAVSQMKSDSPDAMPFYKCGILIEGEAGLGKSTLLKAVLERNGYSKDAKDPQKKYYEISAGNWSEVQEILLKARKEGSAVIYDEANVDDIDVREATEKLLNQIFSDEGVDLDKPDRPGFKVLMSQNPSTSKYEGRKSLSPALRNRMHVLHMEECSDHALEALATHYGTESPRDFVAAYQRCKKDYAGATNMRTFYTALAAGIKLEEREKIGRGM